MVAQQQTTAQPELERRLIADLIYFGPSAVAVALEAGVKAETFTTAPCQRSFEAILGAHAAGQSADALTLVREAKLAMPEAAKLTADPSPTSAYLRADCGVLVDLAVRRSLIVAATRLSYASTKEPEAIPDAISAILATQTQGGQARSWASIVDDAKDKARAACDPKHDPDAGAISWGWPSLDRAFRRLRRRELTVVAARPSVGKSSLMRQVVGKAALGGLNTMVVSLEVPADDVVQQMASAMSGIPYFSLSRCHPADQRTHLAAYDQLKGANLHCYDSDESLAAIVARARALASQKPLDLLAVDYIGLISDCEPKKGETKAQAVGKVTKALKRLAMNLNCVVMLLCQLNRSPANEDNREPRLSDLRDSGDIEQDADRVVFLHRPDECPIRHEQQGTKQSVDDLPRYYMQLIQDKGRNVGTAWGQMWFNRALARFEVIAEENR